MAADKKSLFVFHFNPVELYPPVMNTIHFLEGRHEFKKIVVFTTSSTNDIKKFKPKYASTKIISLGVTGSRLSRGKRIFTYLSFNLVGLIRLVWNKPDSIVYYETISSFPPLIYKMLNPTTGIFIHYHEYMSPNEYLNGMILVNRLHRIERKMYSSVCWLSHTNQQRIELFLNDNPSIDKRKLHVIPNYPPQDWLVPEHFYENRPRNSKKVEVVYVGALNIDTMYVKEFAYFIIQQRGLFIWNIYSLNLDNETRTFFTGLNCPYICIHAGVSYYELPQILRQHDIGIILYKGNLPNWVYNIPNKLFEYHVSGLDVWFPNEMISSIPMVTQGSYPRIVDVNFPGWQQFAVQQMLNHENMTLSLCSFTCENALLPLEQALLGTNYQQ